MEITVENIEKALHTFYHDAAHQQEIHSWLTAIQGSTQAWTFCWQLLEKQRKPEVQFFGANCLHWKISHYWNELPSEQIGPLRSQLFEQVANYALGPKMILTRLCVALSAFTLHSTPAVWPDAVQNIITTFQQSNLPNVECSQLCSVLLELLTVLPEEFSTCPLPQHQKGVVRAELQKGVQHVLPLLGGLISPDQPAGIHDQALRCLASWVQFGVPLPDTEPLVSGLVNALQKDRLFPSAIDALVNVFSHQENYRYPNCLQRMLPVIVQLQPLLQEAAREKDMERVGGLVRLIVCAADSSSKLLVELSAGTQEQAQLAMAIVRLVMECTALPGFFPVDENHSDLAFGFWYNLQDDIVTSDSSQFSRLSQMYLPLYMNLVDVLLLKLQYPPDAEYESWNAEEKELQRCYRQDISDTLMYAYNLLNNLLLNNLCRLLSSILEKSSAEEVRWQEVEAVLFAVTSIAESVDLEESTFLPALFQMLGRVPCSNQKLVAQALYLIGSYAEWLSVHPELLSSVLPLILQGLRDVELAQPATLSLKEVVRENQEHLLIYVQEILVTSKEALESNILKPRDTVRLMACLGYVLSVLPVKDIMAYLDQVLTPHLTFMQQLARTQPSVSHKNALVVRLNMVSWLFSSLNINWRDDPENPEANQATSQEPQPVLLLLQKILPILEEVLNTWVTDTTVVEAVCDMLKRALRTLMSNFVSLAYDTSRITLQMFTAAPQASVLDLAKQLLVLFASDEMYHSTGSVLFHGICVKCLAVYESGIREHPDLANGFMSFLAQVAKKCSALFAEENCNLAGLFQAGVISLSMPESPTVKSSCQFLSELIMCSPKIPAVQEVVAQNAPMLVERLVRAIGGESPRSVIDPMADVFLALNKNHLELVSSLLKVMANQDGFPNERAKKQEKEQFCSRVLKERVNKRRLKETITEFTLLWRGLIGTEYAAQTTT